METGGHLWLDSSFLRLAAGPRRKMTPIFVLAVTILGFGFVPRARAQGVVGYVANSADNKVSLVFMDANNDPAVTALVGSSPQTVTVGTSPVRVAASSNFIFVTNQGSNSITVIDPKTNTALPTTIQIQPIAGGPDPKPQGLAILENQAGVILYVANSGDNSVSVINATNIQTGTFTEVARLTTGIGPNPIEVALQGAKAYVLNNNAGGVGTISTIQTGSNTLVAQTIQVGQNATSLAASPDGAVLYVTNRGDNSVTVVNVTSLAQTQITGVQDPVAVAFDPNPAGQAAQIRAAYVTNYANGTLTEILDDVKCNNGTNGQCFTPNPLPLPAGAHPSQIQVVPGIQGESHIFISDPVSSAVYTFVPFNTPTVAKLIAGNVAAGMGFFTFGDSTNPNPPICGLTQNLDGTGDNVTGICIGGGAGGTAPSLSFQTDGGFGCAGGPSCLSSNPGFVGGFQDYGAVLPGVYTVIVCSVRTDTPPACGGVTAQSLIAWPGGSGTPPAIACTQFTATPDPTHGVTANASATCNDSVFGLPNHTDPPVNLSLIMKLDWGDGTFPSLAARTQATGNQFQPPVQTHQYAKAGTYNVTLTAGDTTLLAAAPQTIPVTVTDAAPTCTFPAPSVNGFVVIAAPTCFDEFGKPVSQIVISWGPNVPNSPTTLTGAQVNQSTMFTYPTTATPQPFTISVVATAQGLASTAVTQMVTVPSSAPQPPSCTISATATLFSAQAPVTCNETAPGDVIASVTVSWGDDTTSSATPGAANFSQTFQHAYPAGTKTYTVSVVATDLAGLQGTAQTTLAVTGPVPPRCTLSVQGTGGLGASATAQCVDDDAVLTNVTLAFGDGTVVQGTAGTPNFGPQTFTHNYAAAGTYTVTFTAGDLLEQVTTLTGSVTVPTLTVTGPSDATVSAGGTVSFTVTVPQDLPGTGPLTLSCAPNPPQTALPPGVVCLFSPVTINRGETSTLTIATDSAPLPATSALRMPSLYGLWLSLFPAMLLIGSRGLRKTDARRGAALALAIALILMLAACGTNLPAAPTSGDKTPPGTYTVLIEVSDAKLNTVLGTSPVTITVK